MEHTLFQHSPGSMQTLLHSSEDDIFPPGLLLNRTYTPNHLGENKLNTWDLNHQDPSPFEERVQVLSELRLPAETPNHLGENKLNTWDLNHQDPSAFEERVQVLSELRLPADTPTDNTTPISRFMTDNNSSRPLVDITTTQYVPPHRTHLSIATSWAGSHYDYPSSAVSSIYEYQFPHGGTASTGSPVEQHFEEIEYDGQPGYQRRDSGGHSQGSSIDGIGCLSPSSPELNTPNQWRRYSDHSVDSNIEINNVSPTGHRHSHDSFVSLKSIQLSPGEDDNDGGENLMGRPHSNSIPGIYLNGHEHSDHEHDTGRTSPWDPTVEFFPEDSMDISCTSPTSKVPPSSPRAATMLEGRRERRRSRSGSAASQPPSKARSDMMQPHPDAIINANGKSHKGRGAGKKTKERQVCPDHPNKSFRHDSDFRKHMQTKHTRPFLCTFRFAGCEQTFGSKNEWKRHVFSQHLQLHYWRCDYAECTDRKAYFNRKDLFGQHLKRMHGPKNTAETKNWLEKEIPQIQDRCRKERRAAPETSKCGYCGAEFSGHGSWDTRMEHVGKHYEKNNYKHIDTKTWVMDEGLIRWSLDARIIERTPEGVYKLLCHGKDSIEGEERRKSSQYEAPAFAGSEDAEEDAEGEYEN